MNYLAHLALSGNEEEIIAGNYIGDSLRGIDISTFPGAMQKGIRLHRFIDNFTDHHPLFLEAKRIFAPGFDKYSGTLVDICFDHFLAKDFSSFHQEPLQEFAYRKYQVIGKFYYLYPEKAKLFYQYMVQNNILYNYSERQVIEKVLVGLTHRIKRRALLHEGFAVFLDEYHSLEKLFKEFYPELKKQCEQKLLESEISTG